MNFSAVNGNQGLNRLEKYFNIYDCLVKSLKVKSALKSAEKSLKGLEKSKNLISPVGFNTVVGVLSGLVVTWFLLGYSVRMFEYTVRTF